MIAHPTTVNKARRRTTPCYGYDIGCPPFRSAGISIFGYDASANRFKARNLEPSAGNTAKFRQFTGKERDSESGLDYFGARYYGGALGRWTSPDSINLTDDRLMSPSNTINKYVYGGNNPFEYIDPDGRDITLFYTNEGPAGHEMLYAYDTSNGNSAVHSFGPESHGVAARMGELFDIPISGKNGYGLEDIKSPDDLRQHYASFTVYMGGTALQRARIF
jgi:RHS repeat-associated protein